MPQRFSTLSAYLLFLLSEKCKSIGEQLMVFFSSLPSDLRGYKLAVQGLVIIVLIHIQIHILVLLLVFSISVVMIIAIHIFIWAVHVASSLVD